MLKVPIMMKVCNMLKVPIMMKVSNMRSAPTGQHCLGCINTGVKL